MKKKKIILITVSSIVLAFVLVITIPLIVLAARTNHISFYSKNRKSKSNIKFDD